MRAATVIELRILKGYSTKETARIMEKKGYNPGAAIQSAKNLSAILENMGS